MCKKCGDGNWQISEEICRKIQKGISPELGVDPEPEGDTNRKRAYLRLRKQYVDRGFTDAVKNLDSRYQQGLPLEDDSQWDNFVGHSLPKSAR